MADLRIWQLPLDVPRPLAIAADARLGPTDPQDDQTWEVVAGQGERAGISLQTRYGGRAGLVSLVPLWHIDGQTISVASQYARPMTLRGFTASFVQLETRLTPTLGLLAEFWALDSHAVGGRFLLRSQSKSEIAVHLDLLGFIGLGGREVMPKVVFLPGERHSLSLGVIGDLTPLVVLDNGFAAADSGGNKISAAFNLPPGGRFAVRFVCASKTDPRESMALARRALSEDWGPAFKRLSVAANAAPRIETGDLELDAALAFGYSRLIQSLMTDLAAPPALGFVSTRTAQEPRRGKRRAERDMLTAYTTALNLAAVDPARAQGILQAYVAGQGEDGWIDGSHKIGDRPTYLCPPMLARLAWSLFQYSEDSAFLSEVYPKLLRFFERWLAADMDVDGDGAPEWQSTAQMGLLSRLSLAAVRIQAQYVETPGLAAQLHSEALSLREIAHFLRDAETEARLSTQVERLRGVVQSFWNAQAQRFVYRDRDTHQAGVTRVLVADSEGDADLRPALTLDPPSRVIIKVEGGFEHTPRLRLHLEGVTPAGDSVEEIAEWSLFEWETGRGYYTSQAVFARLDRLHCEGLVRVYKVSAFTPDLSMEDFDSLIPLWGLALTSEQAAQLEHQAVSRYLTAQGLAAEPAASDTPSRIDPALSTLIGEGLLEMGAYESALAVVRPLLSVDSTGRGGLSSVPPLHVFLRLLGVRVISRSKLWVGGPFVWGAPVKIIHKGVTIERSAAGTRITFPSRRTVELPADAPFGEIVDVPPKKLTPVKSS